nr:MAG TPA: zinc knuckle protein [Caudoviricetes sp.]
MRVLIDILIDKADYLPYCDYCRLLHILRWNT